ncbi:MAG: peptidylprolyl isomerase [Saprospiraceae bacterium]|nr:peptidylprolyl isomerase [Saprospiraceae bacterium]MCF8250274.1 peptidylprolyl isomerase [Saprospiraceae bacterium]MCF8280898.1 peptidylprolyl isomerase [Bacteroidales bacterium]MCF8312094.1 peptidylprolyl isomerase [Saprospiraceae bacterium]MCF8440501.1 peptidylprolyl isomerase [Saprospiraceae bacterium]
MSKYLPLFIVCISLFTQCVPPSEEKAQGVHLDFTNPTYQAVYDLKDRGQTDSLLSYFKNKDATLRYMAVIAFASIKDNAAIDSLAYMLGDPEEEIRIAAAYALGQIGDKRAEPLLLKGFDRSDTVGISKNINAAIMEAVGKCGTMKMLDALTSISSYRVTDTTLLEGQAWGIYRFGLRDSISLAGTAKMMDFATSSKYPNSVRFIGANYLSRMKKIELEKGDSILAPALTREEDYRIRMCLAIALGKTKTERATNALLLQYNVERDYRVKCNILRALGNFDYETVKATVYNALSDQNIPVAITAAEFFVDHGVATEASTYWEIAKQPGRKWQVAMTMYAAASKYLPYGFEETRKYLNWEIKRRFENADSPYEKAAALKALGQYGWNYHYIRDAAYPSEFVVVRTAAVEALGNIAKMPNFNAFFGGGNTARRELAECLQDAITTGDVGMMAVAAEVLRDSTAKFKTVFDSVSVFENALKKLRLPQEIETYNEVKLTLDYFKGEKSAPTKPKFTHKIDWKIITDLKPGSTVVIKTKKGNITLDLLPDQAPGTVSNFLELIKDKYYNGKNFHRIVPNFVAQGGCSRGDGYGGPSYAIRSELPYLHYDQEGYVGMASAGNNTESSQFFITYSPTPHLDGKYTIFAKVIEGMDVVTKLQIGDLMEEVTLVEPKS